MGLTCMCQCGIKMDQNVGPVLYSWQMPWTILRGRSKEDRMFGNKEAEMPRQKES